MTERATLDALLARVLEGTGPDRELDFEIAAAFGWPDSPNLHQHARRYTESMEAALTLVPEGRDWHVQSNPSVGACWASISPAKHDLKLREWGSGMMKAATPERALIAACIKARMEAQGE